MTHLLDTDICVEVLRNRLPAIARLQLLSPVDCAVSTITVYELFCGVEKSRNPAVELEKVQRLVSAVIELPFDRAAVESAAKIRVDLERQGTVIGPYDLLIAGQAMVAGLTLVTNNVREFQRVNGLRLESWP